MKERVIKSFIDKDTKKGYNEGSFYESDDKERVEFLKDKGYLYKKSEVVETSNEEEQKEPSGNEDSDNVYPIDKGSGWYELSDGKKIQGEEKAIAAQEELDKEG